jgi:hypothetical protein
MMPKINAQPSATGYSTPPPSARFEPLAPRPEVISQPNTVYPHNPADHWTYSDGTLVCLCICLRCWPESGGACPDERGSMT